MKQMSLVAAAGFSRNGRVTKRATFLAEMDRIVPWSALCAVVEPFYPKAGNGRPPIALERMLRMYFLAHWFNLADAALEEAVYDSEAMRQFLDIDLTRDLVPTRRPFASSGICSNATNWVPSCLRKLVGSCRPKG